MMVEELGIMPPGSDDSPAKEGEWHYSFPLPSLLFLSLYFHLLCYLALICVNLLPLGLVTFLSFIFFGAIPLLPYLIGFAFEGRRVQCGMHCLLSGCRLYLCLAFSISSLLFMCWHWCRYWCFVWCCSWWRSLHSVHAGCCHSMRSSYLVLFCLYFSFICCPCNVIVFRHSQFSVNYYYDFLGRLYDCS